MSEKNTPKRLRKLAVLFIALGAAIFAGTGLVMAYQNSLLSENELCELSSGSCDTVLFEPLAGGGAVAVYNDGEIGALISVDSQGNMIAGKELSVRVDAAKLYGDNLFLLYESGAGLSSACFDAVTLDERYGTVFSVSLPDLVYCGIDGSGSLIYVTGDDFQSIYRETPEGTVTSCVYPEDIYFFALSTEGKLVVRGAQAQSEITVFDADSLTEERRIACSVFPETLLGGDCFTVFEGAVYSYSGESAAKLIDADIQQFDGLFLCLDGENCLLLPDFDGKIERLGLDGGLNSGYQYEGELCAINADGALLERDGKLFYAPFESQTEPPESSASSELESSEESSTSSEPESSEESSAASESESSEESTSSGTVSEPEPTPNVPIEFPVIKYGGEKYLVLPLDMSVEELERRFAPAFYNVEYPDGETVAAGNVATGMTAGEYTLVVGGDTDGNGYINSADLIVLEKDILGETELEGAYCIAADLNGALFSGRDEELDDKPELNTQDLVLLQKLLAE